MKYRELTWNQQRSIMEAARSAAPVFEQNQWTYGFSPNDERPIPDAATLALTIQGTVMSFLNEGADGAISSGRFTVEKDPFDTGVGFVILLEVGDVNIRA